MKQLLKWETWVYGLVGAFIGGGASAVTGGFSAAIIAPDKFNVNTGAGFGHIVEMMGACFLINGLLGMFLYLKQSPVPPVATGNTEVFTKPPQPPTT